MQDMGGIFDMRGMSENRGTWAIIADLVAINVPPSCYINEGT